MSAAPLGSGAELLYQVAERSAWLRRMLAAVRKPELDAVVAPILDRIDAAVADGQADMAVTGRALADFAYVHALLAGGVIE